MLLGNFSAKVGREDIFKPTSYMRVGLVQGRDKLRALVSAIINPRIPQNTGKLSSGYTTGGLSSSAQFHRISYHIRTIIYHLLIRPPSLNVNRKETERVLHNIHRV
jgi:hypothetical protein